MSGAIAPTIQARRDFPRPLGRATELSEQSLLHVCDFQEPYLRTIVGFVGIADLHFVNAEPMDIILDLREAAINAAVAKALALVSDRHWDGASSIAGVENLPQLKPASHKASTVA